MTRARGRRPLACRHEAGHAVARWWLGFDSDGAQVLSGDEIRSGVGIEDREGKRHVDSEGMSHGHPIAFVLGRSTLDGLEGEELARMERDGRRRVEMALVESAAGLAAEVVHRRRSWLACRREGGAGDAQDAEQIAASWFRDDAGDSDEWHTMLEAERVARMLVRSSMARAAIKAVADALHARGRVTGEEVDALCSAAYNAPFAYDRWAECWPPTDEQIRLGYLPPKRTPKIS